MTNELNEAGGVAWTDIYRKDGGKVSLTARAADPQSALDALQVALNNVEASDYWQMSPNAIQRDQYIAEARPEFQAVHADNAAKQEGTVPAGDEWFQIAHVTPEMTKTGKVMFKAFGGRWMKFGVTLWPEVAATMIKDPEDRPAGVEIPTPGLLGRVEYNDKGNPSKVVELAKG